MKGYQLTTELFITILILGVTKWGQCEKTTGFQCSTSLDSCIEHGDTNVCNGRGVCVCGNCTCKAEYSGLFCETECTLCSVSCEDLKLCVQCMVHMSGVYEDDDECEERCSLYPSPEVVHTGLKTSKDEKYCAFVDDMDGCRFAFLFGYNFQNHLYNELIVPSDSWNRFYLRSANSKIIRSKYNFLVSVLRQQARSSSTGD